LTGLIPRKTLYLGTKGATEVSSTKPEQYYIHVSLHHRRSGSEDGFSLPQVRQLGDLLIRLPQFLYVSNPVFSGVLHFFISGSMTMATKEGPRAWKAADVRNDLSWIRRLTPEAAQGFDEALAHAKRLGKPLLEMEQADFPLPPASREALEEAIAATQGRWGMVLVKGFPTDGWSEEDMRVAYWGMSLYMGVGRAQNKASEIINDVRDTGGSYYVKGGRGYNTNVQLDFHQDYSDVGRCILRVCRDGRRWTDLFE
jgi:hypothetical protein